jgi:hypothetical protein
MISKNTPLKGKLKGNKGKYQLVKKTLSDLTEDQKSEILRNSIKNISKYSIKNQLLILLQEIDITELKGYKAWENEGFKPIPNSGIFIYQPILDKEDNSVKGYFLGTIFDKKDVIPIKE